ncbi:hypothetical protein JOE58_002015 [Curtobacterium luteum]|uniref:Uncharacterized protein n=1 Tax=Curtobacterium luteum TaxID=33881 RepID=A0ABS2RUR7_9MICO|nr:hypothetical protein [Curtobacterium sp. DN_7.5]MBM7802764.1 hypothetical protein [Curtobacterium luteum]
MATDPDDARHRDVGGCDGAGFFAGEVQGTEEDGEERVAAASEPDRIPVLRDRREHLADGRLVGGF